MVPALEPDWISQVCLVEGAPLHLVCGCHEKDQEAVGAARRVSVLPTNQRFAGF